MGPKTTPFFKRPLVWTFASAVALTKRRMGQCTALLIPASNGPKLSSAQSWKVTPRRWNAHFHTFCSLICDDAQYWVNESTDLTLGLGSVKVAYILLFDLMLFHFFLQLLWLKSASHWKCRWSALLIWICSVREVATNRPKPRSRMCWATWQSLHEYVSGCHSPQCHRCHDMLHFLVLCWLKSRIMNHVATYFPSSKIFKDTRREKVWCAQAAANDNQCLNMSQQFDCWIRVRSEWMQFESALIFCAPLAVSQQLFIAGESIDRNHITEIAMNNTYFSQSFHCMVELFGGSCALTLR